MFLKCSSAVLAAIILLCVYYPSDGQTDLESVVSVNESDTKSSCTCVPHSFCNNNTSSISSNQENNRDNGTSSCNNALDVCCEDISNKTTETETSSMGNLFEKGIKANYTRISRIAKTSSLEMTIKTEGILITNDSSHNSSSCTCVPFYLCNITSNSPGGNEEPIDIRENKESTCDSYLETCCKDNRRTDVILTPTARKAGCGYRNEGGLGFKIFDIDFEAQYGEFPWMTAVLRKVVINGEQLNVYKCGGALISPEVVMTAAHCVAELTQSDQLMIRAGEWDTQTKKEIFPHQNLDVASFIIHPQYNKGRLYNDIALLFLKTPVIMAGNVDVVCLPSQNEVIESQKCFITGWGRNVFGKKGKYQVILKKIGVPMVPRARCQENLRKKTKVGRYFELHESFVCAGGESGKDACKGDGGGPLVCPISGHEKEERYAQVGIVAWGSGCGEADVPGVYVNVALFRDWIDEQMKLKNLDSRSYQFT